MVLVVSRKSAIYLLGVIYSNGNDRLEIGACFNMKNIEICSRVPI